MTSVHQLLVGASPGDAVTEFAFAIRKGLRQFGPSEIYASHREPVLHTDVREANCGELARGSADDILVYHSSIGEPEMLTIIEDWPGRVVVYFHNVVPAHYFLPYDPYWASLLELGRLEVEALRERSVLTVSNSEYSARDLRDMGYDEIRVIPPVSSLYRLRDAVPNPATVTHLETHVPQPMILYIGQLLPQKRVDILLDALHVASTYLGIEPTLMLVGPGRLARFEGALREKTRQLKLRTVHFAGHRDAADLAALMRHASFLVTASAWESYCVPLVEAMSLGMPIVCRATTVIPETLGSAGLQLPADSGAELMAEAWFRVLRDDDLRASLAKASEVRFAELEKLDPAGDFISAIGELR